MRRLRRLQPRGSFVELLIRDRPLVVEIFHAIESYLRQVEVDFRRRYSALSLRDRSFDLLPCSFHSPQSGVDIPLIEHDQQLASLYSIANLHLDLAHGTRELSGNRRYRASPN